ncbi:uncharacterized protein [Apostichopus japonicus]|uniref:uncharacterized protein n=1 Tax=Stichopus japonicus TaxID=307972 RepID=UPI003AB4DE32
MTTTKVGSGHDKSCGGKGQQRRLVVDMTTKKVVVDNEIVVDIFCRFLRFTSHCLPLQSTKEPCSHQQRTNAPALNIVGMIFSSSQAVNFFHHPTKEPCSYQQPTNRPASKFVCFPLPGSTTTTVTIQQPSSRNKSVSILTYPQPAFKTAFPCQDPPQLLSPFNSRQASNESVSILTYPQPAFKTWCKMTTTKVGSGHDKSCGGKGRQQRLVVDMAMTTKVEYSNKVWWWAR